MYNTIKNMKPFLKWAGGKTQLLQNIIPKIPDFDEYYEPFLGAGALLLHLQPRKARVNDINPQLINCWIQIRDRLPEVLETLEWLDSRECDAFFYTFIRDEYNDKIQFNMLDPECAGMLIWINKHCFNGLYRVNKYGFFNVPWNKRKKGASYDRENLESISKYLNDADVEFSSVDFEDAVSGALKEDFIYFDSPYAPVSETADFTQYAKTGFSLVDHQRLANLYRSLTERKVRCMLSNNDVSLIRELYAGYSIEPLNVSRSINRNGSLRKGKEVLITNYITQGII